MDMKGNNSPMVLHNMQIALAQFITSQLDTKIHIKKKNLTDLSSVLLLSNYRLNLLEIPMSIEFQSLLLSKNHLFPLRNQINLNLLNVAIKPRGQASIVPEKFKNI